MTNTYQIIEGNWPVTLNVVICDCQHIYAYQKDPKSREFSGSSWHYNKKREIVIKVEGGQGLREETIERRGKGTSHYLLLEAVRRHIKTLSDQEAEKAILDL